MLGSVLLVEEVKVAIIWAHDFLATLRFCPLFPDVSWSHTCSNIDAVLQESMLDGGHCALLEVTLDG